MLVAQRPHTSCLEDQTRIVRDVGADPARRESAQEVSVRYDEHVEGRAHAAFRLPDGGRVVGFADGGDQGVAAGGYVGWGSGRGVLEIGEKGRTRRSHGAKERSNVNALSARTAIAPNIPLALAALLPPLANLLARHALVVAVIPLPHTLRDLDTRLTLLPLHSLLLTTSTLLGTIPWQPALAAQIKQLERALRPAAGRDVDARQVAGHDEAVVADEGATCGADALFAVGCERDVGQAGVFAVERPGGFAVADYEDAGGCHCFFVFSFAFWIGILGFGLRDWWAVCGGSGRFGSSWMLVVCLGVGGVREVGLDCLQRERKM